MRDNYTKIVQDNLTRLYRDLPGDLAATLPGTRNGDNFIFRAFGQTCVIRPQGIESGQENHSSVLNILISLYALNACSDICLPFPLKAFAEFDGSMPYAGAFKANTEQVLVPHVAKIKASVLKIRQRLNGQDAPPQAGGDFSLLVYPLPKIALCYIFYEADDDFPASVTCLYSNNAHQFMPIDGLADVGEYTSAIISKLSAL